MKTYRYITLAAMALTFAACSQDEDFAPQTDCDAVKINATIGTMPQTRLAYGDKDNNNQETTTFENGDKIRVQNTKRTTKNVASYTYNGSSWSTTDFLVWNGSSVNQFEAWYPVADYSSFITFQLPTDQSTHDLLTAADWMTASTDEMNKTTDGTINLAFTHLLTKVTVKVQTWNSEFGYYSQTISYPKIRSKCAAVTVSYGTGTGGANVYNPQGSATDITPLEGGDSEYPTYTAIIAPVKYDAFETFMTFDIDEKELTVLTKEGVLTDGLQPGYHYTFNLTVGKERVEIKNVEIEPWGTTDNIDGGVAEGVVTQ